MGRMSRQSILLLLLCPDLETVTVSGNLESAVFLSLEPIGRQYSSSSNTRLLI